MTVCLVSAAGRAGCGGLRVHGMVGNVVTFANGSVCAVTFLNPTQGYKIKFEINACYPVRKEVEPRSAHVLLVSLV